MKNLNLLFLIIVFSCSALADEFVPIDPGPSVDGIDHFKTSPPPSPTPSSPAPYPGQQISNQDFGMGYVRLGRSITSISDSENTSNLVGSLGYRHYSDSIIWGLEYSYHYDPTGIRFNEYDVTGGFRPSVSSKVAPYLIGGAGLSASSGTNSDGQTGGDGINYFGDVGLDLINVEVTDFRLKVMGGLRLTHEELTGGYTNNRNFTDLYLAIGFGW
jgi:hypothetical protein